MADTKPSLPDSLRDWKNERRHLQSWEQMRPFFKSKGYDLYKRKANGSGWSIPWDTPSKLLPDGNGIYGSHRYIPDTTVLCPVVWAARNSRGEDVVLKVVSCGEEGSNELDILKFLSREPFKSDPDNHTVPVLEFIKYESYTFVVLPRWGKCDEPIAQSVAEVFDFCIQVAQGLSFLHRHLIAHLDIAFENILMNFLGYEQIHRDVLYLDLRGRFPVKYSLIDFGYSRRFPQDTPPSARLVSDMYAGRPHKAPELDLRKPYDPFAADVYQLGKVLISYFYNLTILPGFLKLVQDMTAEESGQRITMAEVHRRLCELRDECPWDYSWRTVTVHFVAWMKTPTDDDDATVLRRFMAAQKEEEEERWRKGEYEAQADRLERVALKLANTEV
ncbi:hypothetical protein PLICRDRAFT_53874 [Plicaturopsis crispa FD-325 SS-3]|nr:hypothetical protein PLICRDRAFT_53874 [Plicaturopsis crispa FD-325 SS-3]